jgi:hypothetical protein
MTTVVAASIVSPQRTQNSQWGLLRAPQAWQTV